MTLNLPDVVVLASFSGVSRAVGEEAVGFLEAG